jgi:DNA-binding NarL/FixJ family response regulator
VIIGSYTVRPAADCRCVGRTELSGRGFVAKLVEAVKSCAAGETLLAPSVVHRLISTYVQHPPAPPTEQSDGPLAALTPRELDVLRAIARGLSNAEISAELYLAEATVKTHITRILAKLGLRDRVQAVVLAYETGLVLRR